MIVNASLRPINGPLRVGSSPAIVKRKSIFTKAKKANPSLHFTGWTKRALGFVTFPVVLNVPVMTCGYLRTDTIPMAEENGIPTSLVPLPTGALPIASTDVPIITEETMEMGVASEGVVTMVTGVIMVTMGVTLAEAAVVTTEMEAVEAGTAIMEAVVTMVATDLGVAMVTLVPTVPAMVTMVTIPAVATKTRNPVWTIF